MATKRDHALAKRELDEHREMTRGIKPSSTFEFQSSSIHRMLGAQAPEKRRSATTSLEDKRFLSTFHKTLVDSDNENFYAVSKKRKMAQADSSVDQWSDDDGYDEDEDREDKISDRSAPGRDGAALEKMRIAGMCKAFGAPPEPLAQASASQVFVHKAGAAGGGGGDMGSAPVGPPEVQHVPLMKVANKRRQSNAKYWEEEMEEILHSSCEELEQEIAEERRLRSQRLLASRGSASHRRKRRRQEAHKRFAEFGSLANEYEDDDDDADLATESADRLAGRDYLFGGGAGGGGGGGGGRRSRADDSDTATPSVSLPAPRPPSSTANRALGGAGRTIESSMNCFMCRFGKREFDKVNREEMDTLRRELEEGIGHRNLWAHCKMIHKLYMETIFFTGRSAGRDMPVWRTYQVYEHITSHDDDPRIFLLLWLRHFKTIGVELVDSVFVDAPGGGTVFDRAKNTALLNTVKMIMALYKADPSKMNFHDDSADINLSAANKRVEGLLFEQTVQRFGAIVK